MKIAQPEAVSYCKALFFAPPGAGKTYLLGTAEDDPRTAPTLILDFEGGVQTLVGRKIDVAVIRDWQDYAEAYDILSDPKTKYRSAGVDSISETQAGGLLHLLEERSPEGKRATDDTLTQGDWGTILVQMRRFIRHFKNLPMHVFMTALADDDLDKLEGKVRVPLMQGHFAKEVGGIFDVVAYLGQQTLEDESGDTERLLLLRNYPGFRIKARTKMGVVPPDAIREPTITKLLDELGYTAREGK